MITKEAFLQLCSPGPVLMDGATGSNLMKAGMPRGCCTEEWILANPEKLVSLQRRYVEAGSQILLAPTFQAQPIALERVHLQNQTEAVNAHLASLTRSVSPDVLVAGDLTTLATFTDSWDVKNFDLLVENYRRQIKGLADGGVDLLVAETLMYPTEAEAIFTAAELESVPCCVFTFTMQPDGSLFSGMDAIPVLKELEEAGAAAVGFNCVAADSMTPGLVSKLRRHIRIPIVCKPNAGIPTIGPDQLPHYPMGPGEFSEILADCHSMGASILGGCCGTAPEFIAALKQKICK